MKKFILLIVITLQGCGVYECIDMNFDRSIKPIDKTFNVTLEFQDIKKSMNIQCEEYYDAMCAERGNYWAIREVDEKSQYQVSSFEFTDSKLGVIQVPIPSCNDMVKEKNTPLKHIMPKIDGKTYWLKSSNGEYRIYKASTRKGLPEEVITVKLSLKVNNVPLK